MKLAAIRKKLHRNSEKLTLAEQIEQINEPLSEAQKLRKFCSIFEILPDPKGRRCANAYERVFAVQNKF